MHSPKLGAAGDLTKSADSEPMIEAVRNDIVRALFAVRMDALPS